MRTWEKIFFVCLFFLINIFLFSSSEISLANTIVLKSGQNIKGKIVESNPQSVKLDKDGLIVTYYSDEIETIDGHKLFDKYKDSASSTVFNDELSLADDSSIKGSILTPAGTESLNQEIESLIAQAHDLETRQKLKESFDLIKTAFDHCNNIDSPICLSVLKDATRIGSLLIWSSLEKRDDSELLNYSQEHIKIVEKAGGLENIRNHFKELGLSENDLVSLMEFNFSIGYLRAGIYYALHDAKVPYQNCLDKLKDFAPMAFFALKDALTVADKLSANESWRPLFNVIFSFGYTPLDTYYISELLFPVYKKMEFGDINNPQKVLADLKKNITVLNDELVEGDRLSEKNLILYSLIVDRQANDLINEGLRQGDNGWILKSVFQCAYFTFLGWVILESKGLNVQGIYTQNLEIMRKTLAPKWKKFLVNVGLFKFKSREYHLSCVVHLNNGESVFVDFTNRIMNKPFSLKDDCLHLSEQKYRFFSDNEAYIYREFEFYTIQQIRAALLANHGSLCYSLGKFERSLAYQKEALVLFPNNDRAYSNIGLIYLEKDQIDEAEKYFKHAIFLNTDNEDGYYGLGRVRFSLEQYEEAIYYFKKSIAIDPYSSYSYEFLGRSYGVLGDRVRAKRNFEIAIRLFKERNFSKNVKEIEDILSSLKSPSK